MSATAIVGLAPTVLGPLTTVFTPPPQCTVVVGQVDGGLLGLGLLGGGSEGNFAFVGQTCKGGQPADARTCWPATSSGAPAPPSPFGGWGVYSPGIECPAGYATACSATAGGASGWPLQFQLTTGETAVGCCPSGYGCANIGGQTCTMIATSTVIQTAACDGDKVGALAANTFPRKGASDSAFSLYAPMIQINFQSSDLPASPSVIPAPGPNPATLTTRTTTTVLASAPSPKASSSTPSDSQPPPQQTSSDTTTSQTPTPSTSPEVLLTAPFMSSRPSPTATSPPADLQSSTTDSAPPSTGLPRLAAVGIGVGGGVAALLIGGSAMLYFLRRRRLRREDENLDRLYGLGKLDSVTVSDGSPGFGFYRGQVPTRPPPSMRQVNF